MKKRNNQNVTNKEKNRTRLFKAMYILKMIFIGIIKV